MEEDSNLPYDEMQFPREEINASHFSRIEKDELARHIAFLELELSKKDLIIQALRDSAESSPEGSTVEASPLGKAKYEDILDDRQVLISSLAETLEHEKGKVQSLTEELFDLKMKASSEIQQYKDVEQEFADKRGLALKYSYEKKIDELRKERDVLKNELFGSISRENSVREKLLSVANCDASEFDFESFRNQINGFLSDMDQPSRKDCKCLELEGQVKDLEDQLGKANGVIEKFASQLKCLNVVFDDIFKMVASAVGGEDDEMVLGENDLPTQVVPFILTKMKKCYSGVSLMCRTIDELQTESENVKCELNGRIKEMELKLEEAKTVENEQSGQSELSVLKDENESLKRHNESLRKSLEALKSKRVSDGSREADKNLNVHFWDMSNISAVADDNARTPERAIDSAMATSTPFPVQVAHLFGGGEGAPLQTDDSLFSPVKWMEKCLNLEKENTDLKNRVLQMQSRIVELEVIDQDVQKQIACLDIRRTELEKKITDLKLSERNRVEASEKNKMSELKVAQMEDRLKVVEDENRRLCAEKGLIEKKHQDLLDSCHEEGKIDANEKFWKDFNEMIHEIIHLNGRIKLYEVSTDKLKKDLASMFSKQNHYILKLANLSSAWSSAKRELEDANTERLELSKENRLKEKEIDFLKLKIKNLMKSAPFRGNVNCCSTAEEIHKEALELCKRVFEQKMNVEKESRKKGSSELVTNMDARHRYELTLKNNQELIFEKQRLLEQIAEQQAIINDFQKNVGFDEGWLLRFDEVQREFLKEVKYHREQHARIEEALRSTGSLHDELQKEKDALRLKMHEIIKLEKKLDEEIYARKETENKNRLLKTEIERTNTLLDILEKENNDFEEKLTAAQSELAAVRAQFTNTSRMIEWKTSCAKLELIEEDVSENCRRLSEQRGKCLEDDFLQAKALVEKHYQESLRRMKFYYHAQFTSMTAQVEEEHRRQVEELTEVIKRQALAVEKSTAENILRGISSYNCVSTNPIYEDILDGLENVKKETEALLGKIELPIRDSLKQKINDQIFYQLALSYKVLMDDHNKQQEIVMDSINQVHREELKIVKLQFEAVKYRELLELSPIDDSSVDKLDESLSTCDSMSDGKVSVVFSKALRIFMNHFSSKLNDFLKFWYPVYETKINYLKREFYRVLSEYEASPVICDMDDDRVSRINTLLTEQNDCASAAKTFVNFVKNYEECLTNNINEVVDLLIQKMRAAFEDVKQNISRESDVLLMKEQLKQLKIEKEDLEKMHQSALLLLKSDYDADVEHTQKLLSELKNCCEVRCDSKALFNLRAELEAKHKREVDELRTYYEEKYAELQKHLYEEIFSQHSKQMSSSSSCSENDLHSDVFDAEDKFCQKQEFPDVEIPTKANRDDRKGFETHGLTNAGHAARVLTDLVLAECSAEIDRETRESKESDCDKRVADRRMGAMQSEWEDFLLDQMRSSVVWKSTHNVKGEILKEIRENMETVLTKNVTELINAMEAEMNKMMTLISRQASRLNSLSEKVTVLRKRSESSKGLTQEDVPNIGKKAILNFINSKGAHLENEPFEEASVSDYLDLKSLANSFQSQTKNQDVLPKETDCQSDEEVENLIKERNFLRSLVINLQTVCRQFESYVRTSEDELLKNICDELKQICEKTSLNDSASTVTGDDWPSRLAPNIQSFVKELNDTLTSEQLDGLSPHFMDELKMCLTKLKSEASALLGITSNLQSEPSVDASQLSKEIQMLQKENEELRRELHDFKRELDNRGTSVYDCDRTGNLPNRASADLRQRVVRFAQSRGDLSNDTVKILEELANEGDKLIEELSKERDELQQKFTAADRQLHSTWKYLEEQTVEREAERDEYSKELLNLSAQLEEKRRETSARLRMNSEVRPHGAQENGSSTNVEELYHDLTETQSLLSESENRHKKLESELKAAVDKVWVLQDIISDLEKQLLAKSEREIALKERLDTMEMELEQQAGAQNAMAIELEYLKNQNKDVSFDQIQELQESLKVKFSSSVVRQLKAQLRDMERNLDAQTKELSSNVTASNVNLSSPSEEISLREQLERSKTPECPSPVALPVDEVNKLHEAIQRHARSDEVALKRVRDQDIRITKLTNYIEELQAERDILQKKVENQMTLTAEANNKLDRIRHRLSSAYNEANDQFTAKYQEMTDKLADMESHARHLQSELDEKTNQLSQAEKIISSLEEKLRSMTNSDNSALDSLRLELASVTSSKNRLEEIVDKLQKERNSQDAKSPNFSAEFVDAMLAEKNVAIEHLEKTIASLQNNSREIDKSQSSSCNSKGHRVSFAVDVETSSNISESDKLRDAPPERSYLFFKSPVQTREDNLSEQQMITFDAPFSPIAMPKSPPEKIVEEKFERELREKDDKISNLEKQLTEFKSLKDDYVKAKADLEMALTSVREDKAYLERQLKATSEESAEKQDQIRQLLQQIHENNTRKTPSIEELRKKDERLSHLEDLVARKNSEMLKTNAEVRALQNVSKNLQMKLKEARRLAEGQGGVELRVELDKMKLELRDAGELLNKEKLLYREAQSKNEQLTEEVESLRREVASLRINIQCVEKKFQDYVISVRNLKNDLFSLRDSPGDSSKTNLKVTEPDEASAIEQLQSEVSKLISKFGQIEFERNQLQTDWVSHKEMCSLNDRSEETSVDKLNSRIRQLEQEAIQMTTSHKKEVNDLLNTIRRLQEAIGLQNRSREAEREAKDVTTAPIDEENLQQPTDFFEKTNVRNKIAALQKTIRDKISTIKDLKERISVDEKVIRSLTLSKHELEDNARSQEKVHKVQSRKIEYLTEELRDAQNKLTLSELSVATERENRVQAEAELDKIKTVSHATQLEDITLIESMRGRLQVLMESELKLKVALTDEQQKNERLQAEVNSLRQLLEEYKKNNQALTVELEKEQRTYSDLHSVLTRERKTLLSLQSQLKTVEQEKILLGKECAALKISLAEEKTKRERLDKSVKNLQISQVVSKKEYDVESLQDYYRHAERNRRRQGSYASAFQSIDGFNKDIEDLLKKRTELIRLIDNLSSEKILLSSQVDQLREDRNKMRLDSTAMDFPPSVLANLDTYLGKYFRAECCRKALVFQKKYLAVALNGYEELHQKACRTLKLNERRPRKSSFKIVAQAVLSIFRMKTIVRKRATSHQVALLGVLRAFGHTSKESLRESGPRRDPWLPASGQLSPSRSRERSQPSFQSEYLKALGEIQFLTSLL